MILLILSNYVIPGAFLSGIFLTLSVVAVFFLTKHVNYTAKEFDAILEQIILHINNDPVDEVSFQVIEQMLIDLYDKTYDGKTLQKAHEVSFWFHQRFQEFFKKA
jgi:hypothetical protein